MTTLGKTWKNKSSSIQRHCVECGKLFFIKSHNSIRCSEECRRIYHLRWLSNKYSWKGNRKITRDCIICGKKFEYSGLANPITCSKECSKMRKNHAPYKNRPEYKLKHMVRQALNTRIKLKNPRYRSIWYMGYTIKEMRKHIESQFKEGMSWDNYGRKGWHIDHIRPLSMFNFFNSDGSINHQQVREAMSLKNLQPLWAEDNLIKGSKVIITKEI